MPTHLLNGRGGCPTSDGWLWSRRDDDAAAYSAAFASPPGVRKRVAVVEFRNRVPSMVLDEFGLESTDGLCRLATPFEAG